MKSAKSTNVQTKEPIICGLQEFSQKYPDNITTNLVYFKHGMKPVESPFESIVELSKHIQEEDKKLVGKFLRDENYEELYKFVWLRRKSIVEIFAARVGFLARNLSLNIVETINSAINKIAPNLYYYIDCERIAHMISSPFSGSVRNSKFSSIEYDEIFTYLFNSSYIPSVVAKIYDYYDENIVTGLSGLSHRRQSENDKYDAEEKHLEILNVIAPIFERLKIQLEWLMYMLRDEARTIYRPMALIETDSIIEQYLKKTYNEDRSKCIPHYCGCCECDDLDDGEIPRRIDIILPQSFNI